MRICMIGGGKLGFPVSVCLALQHEVSVFESNPRIRESLQKKEKYPAKETGPNGIDPFEPYYQSSMVKVVDTLQQAIEGAELIFVAVQTPHKPEYEGITKLPETREDFDYTYLRLAVKEIGEWVKPGQVIVVISTVLPGTMRREIIPLIPKGVGLVYNPFFVAMGTVMQNFLDPEFVLLGGNDLEARAKVTVFYSKFYHNVRLGGLRRNTWSVTPIETMSIESAELVKVAYNSAIGNKIALANYWGEICHKIPGCNVDDVSNALKKATDRIVSTRYMESGVGDSGGCHPRDGIAMSWLARELKLSFDICGSLMQGRQDHAQWLVDLFIKESNGLPMVLLGKAYKPESNLTTGSAALLMSRLLWERGHVHYQWDMHVDPGPYELSDRPQAYLICTKHPEFRELRFGNGSIVVDPFRFLSPQKGVTIIPVGIGK